MRIEGEEVYTDSTIDINLKGRGHLIDTKEILIIGKLKEKLNYETCQPIYINDEGFNSLNEAIKLLETKYIPGVSCDADNIRIRIWEHSYFENDNLVNVIQGLIFDTDDLYDDIIGKWIEAAEVNKDVVAALLTEEYSIFKKYQTDKWREQE